MTKKTKKSTYSLHYCRRRLTGYRAVGALTKHDKYCSLHKGRKIALLEPVKKLKLERYYRKMRVPFVIYADFESVIKPIKMYQTDSLQSHINRYQKHTPISFCFYIICYEDTLYLDYPVEFSAKSETDKIAQIFMNSLEQKIWEIYNKFLKFSKQMIFTRADAEIYAATNTCHICELSFSSVILQQKQKIIVTFLEIKRCSS